MTKSENKHYVNQLIFLDHNYIIIRNLIESLVPYTDTNITDLSLIHINNMIKEHRPSSSFIPEFICSENTRDEFRKYIKDLEDIMGFLQKDIVNYQQKIEELQTPPPPTPEETDSKLRKEVHETNKEVFSKLLPFLLRRVEDLRKMLSCGEDCSHQVLLQNICSVLELDEQDAILRIIDYFKDKTREQILSDHGLVIILALSNIAGYSGEYECSMKGMFLDDVWMFNQLFEKDQKFGLVSFPSLVYRAFENPFIQSSLLIENELSRDKFKTSLRYMNDFSKRLHDINHKVLLTMNSSSFSDRSILYADGYFLCVPDIWNVLQTISE